MVYKGMTYKFLKPSNDPHIHIIITSPSPDGYVLDVNITKGYGKSGTKIFKHEFPEATEEESVIDLNHMSIKKSSIIAKGIEMKCLEQLSNVNNGLLRRIQKGVKDSGALTIDEEYYFQFF